MVSAVGVDLNRSVMSGTCTHRHRRDVLRSISMLHKNPDTFCLAFDRLVAGSCAHRLFVAHSADEMRSCMEHLRCAWRV